MIRIPNKPSKIKRLITTVNNYWRQIIIFFSMVFIMSLFFPRGKTLLYSYQINDIAREEVVAPFNFPILKSEEKLNADLNEAIKSEPYLFIRSQDVVDDQINSINNYFELIKTIQLATKKLKNSSNELYRNRFSDQYNIARVAMQSDSVDLSILNNKILNEFSFAVDNGKWKTIFETDPDDPVRINLDLFKDDITQIARNRWAEGIYDISLSEIIRITDSTFELVECVHEEDSCKVYQCCPTRGPLIALHHKIKQFFEDTTLANIIEDTQSKNFRIEKSSYETAHLS